MAGRGLGGGKIRGRERGKPPHSLQRLNEARQRCSPSIPGTRPGSSTPVRGAAEGMRQPQSRPEALVDLPRHPKLPPAPKTFIWRAGNWFMVCIYCMTPKQERGSPWPCLLPRSHTRTQATTTTTAPTASGAMHCILLETLAYPLLVSKQSVEGEGVRKSYRREYDVSLGSAERSVKKKGGREHGMGRP